mgnify:CR=1 FL=1
MKPSLLPETLPYECRPPVRGRGLKHENLIKSMSPIEVDPPCGGVG